MEEIWKVYKETYPTNRWVTSKENMNNPLTWQHCSESAKKRKNRTSSIKGKKLSEETRRKISEAVKKRWMCQRTSNDINYINIGIFVYIN